MKLIKEVPVKDYVHKQGKKISYQAIMILDAQVQVILDKAVSRLPKNLSVIRPMDIRIEDTPNPDR